MLGFDANAPRMSAMCAAKHSAHWLESDQNAIRKKRLKPGLPEKTNEGSAQAAL